MSTQKDHSTFFTIAAVWNLLAAALFLGLELFSLDLLGFFLNEIPDNFIWFNLFFGLVVVFGIGYYWIGQDVQRNVDIIKMGILGKSIVFILITYAWLNGALTILTAGAGLVDLVFTILFIRVLLQIKN